MPSSLHCPFEIDSQENVAIRLLVNPTDGTHGCVAAECTNRLPSMQGNERKSRADLDGHPSPRKQTGQRVPLLACDDLVVRVKGLEPSWAGAHTDLNRTRLPIPPHPHFLSAPALEA